MSDKLKTDWIINGLLAAIAVLLIGSYASSRSMGMAHAVGGGWETHGVMVLSTSGNAERVVIVDTAKQTILIYHARQGGGLGLSGARSYKYDVELVDTENSTGPKPPWTYFQAKDAYEKK